MRAIAAPAAAFALALAGCAGEGGGPPPKAAFDPRDEAVGCLNGAGIQAAKAGRDEVRVAGGPGSPRIVFKATVNEAEAENLRATTAGAEVIGDAILYVGTAPEEEIDKIEKCLD